MGGERRNDRTILLASGQPATRMGTQIGNPPTCGDLLASSGRAPVFRIPVQGESEYGRSLRCLRA
jgi:hypothetical protein